MRREEIVTELRDAASIATIPMDKKHFLRIAKQVSAMRCETCNHYAVHGDGIWCFNQKYPMCFIVKPDFGCFHHEQKPAG
jgi:hypothetical protein